MAKKMYVGVSDVARNVSKMYVGVNGVARKVAKAYVGVNGVARECYSASSLPKIVTWNGGTDAEIVAMVDAADRGLIELSDYWSVGDERTVHLSAMSATGVSESHVAQDIVLVLSHQGGKILTTPTASGRTTCSFQFDIKDSLKERGYMNSTDTTTGGWSSCARHIWCNNVLKNAFPQTLSPILKQFQNKTAEGGGSSNINTDNDWFALRSEIEIFGTITYSAAGEGSQVDCYKTTANRIKKVNGSAVAWWERSPYPDPRITTEFCIVNSSGSATTSKVSNLFGISPFGVI